MKLFETVNEHNQRVGHFLCNTCCQYYVITPAPAPSEENDSFWQNCGAPSCPSHRNDPTYQRVRWNDI